MPRHPKAALVEAALERAGKNPSWLARALGESKQKVYKWLTDTLPRDEGVFDRMLALIPTPPEELDRPRTLASYAPLQIRFAGIVPAGSDWGDPLESDEMIEVDAKFESPKRFAAQVAGNSCWPALVQGDLTIWHIDEAPAPGLIVLAQNTEGGCTVKELALGDRGTYRLVPINEASTSPPDGDGWRPIARLVGIVRDVRGVELTWYQPRGLRAGDLR